MKQYLLHARLKASHRGLRLGPGCSIVETGFGSFVRIGANSTLMNSNIDDYSYVGNNAFICSATIGKYCSIASDVHLGAASHPTRDFVSSHPIFYLTRPELGWDFVSSDARQEFTPTLVGNDVWIGARAIIRDGIRIGDGAIVGAAAVVVKDIEPFGIYVGVPARLLRYRFEPQVISNLIEMRWWDRDEGWIRTHAAKFRDVNTFIAGVAAGPPDR